MQAPRERRSRRLFPPPFRPISLIAPLFPCPVTSRPLLVAACFEAAVFRDLTRTTGGYPQIPRTSIWESFRSVGGLRREPVAGAAPGVGNFKRGASFAEQVDAKIVHCGYCIARDIVPGCDPRPSSVQLSDKWRTFAGGCSMLHSHSVDRRHNIEQATAIENKKTRRVLEWVDV